jgi:hypothetical protein
MKQFCAGLLILLGSVSSAFAAPLILEDYFRRPAVAVGSFRSTLDGTKRDITVQFRGTWDAKRRTLILDERIAFSDGERQRKTWRLTRTGPRTYVGTREDVVGEARGFIDDKGRVRLRYRAVVGGRTVSFDDLLTLQPDCTIRNIASVSWYFVPVGEVDLHIRPAGKRCGVTSARR